MLEMGRVNVRSYTEHFRRKVKNVRRMRIESISTHTSCVHPEDKPPKLSTMWQCDQEGLGLLKDLT